MDTVQVPHFWDHVTPVRTETFHGIELEILWEPKTVGAQRTVFRADGRYYNLHIQGSLVEYMGTTTARLANNYLDACEVLLTRLMGAYHAILYRDEFFHWFVELMTNGKPNPPFSDHLAVRPSNLHDSVQLDLFTLNERFTMYYYIDERKFLLYVDNTDWEFEVTDSGIVWHGPRLTDSDLLLPKGPYAESWERLLWLELLKEERHIAERCSKRERSTKSFSP